MNFGRMRTPNQPGGKKTRKKGVRFPSEEFPDLGTSSTSTGASTPSSSAKTAKETLKNEPKYFRKEAVEPVLTISIEDYQQWKDLWALKERYMDKQNFPI